MPGITAPQRARTSRTPSGLPNPPIILLTGPEKTGKSPEAAAASASEAIGMTYWIQIGGTSGTADFYGRTPGARYEIVEHDGSFADICDAIRWAMAQPPRDDKRNMIVIDDVTALWDLLGDEVALMSRKRADRRAQANGRRTARLDDPYVDEDRDLWGYAKDRWGEVLWLLRRHTGPALLIARQELVTAYENDKPTRHTTRRIKAEKNLAAAVDAIVEFHAPGEAYVTGLHVVSPSFVPGKVLRYQGIDHLFRVLSYRDAASSRQVTESRPEAYLNEQQPRDQQRQAPAQQSHPELTGKEAVDLVHAALNDPLNPEARLLDIREQWGKVHLQRIPVITKMWGEMDADTLITRSLGFIKERAKQKAPAGMGQPDQNTGRPHEPGSGTSSEQAELEQPREHQASDTHPASQELAHPTPHDPHTAPADHEESVSPLNMTAEETPSGEHPLRDDAEPPADEDAPPPPGPESEEPPADERPEEVSEAEEPQATPSAPAAATAPRASRRNRNEALALKALHAEADVQARARKITVGEHLEPISEAGDPPMTVLRDYLQQHRPAIIAQLEQEGHTELAAYYRNAQSVDPQIQQRFAPYFESAPAGK